VGENRYLCLSCGYAFYACPVCGKAFEQPFQLAGHMRSHRRRQDSSELIQLVLVEVRAVREELRAQRELLERILEELRGRGEPRREQLQGELPDFLRGNPWLSVLRSRGTG
jgi:hypothetical protein